jgi:hypothetical protein
MKNLLSIFFAVLLFLGGLLFNDMEEVYKIPSLFTHFQEHKEEAKGEFSFLDFLLLHYASDHRDDPENSHLPFLEHNVPPLAFTISFVENWKMLIIPIINDHNFFYKLPCYEEVVFSYLQPPKIV